MPPIPPLTMASDVRSGFRPHDNKASAMVIPIFNSLNFAQPALSSVGTSRVAHAPRQTAHTHISAVAVSDRIAGGPSVEIFIKRRAKLAESVAR